MNTNSLFVFVIVFGLNKIHFGQSQSDFYPEHYGI